MSEELVSALTVIVVQIAGVIVLVLKGRSFESKVDKVRMSVDGQCKTLEALWAAQRVSAAKARKSRGATDADVGGYEEPF